MNSRNFAVLLLMWLCLSRETVAVNKSIAETRGFTFYRTIPITQQTCNCPMSFSCSCCQSVIILYTKTKKDLCVNFTYQRNGLNMDVSLNSDTINTMTVINYKAFQFCLFIPGCLFSTACINILQLNQFFRSITVCLRLNIYVKKQIWQINYDCLSVSTELPMLPTSDMTRITDIPTEGTRNKPEKSSITELITPMESTPMVITEISEIGSEDTVGMARQAEEMTKILEINSEQIIVD